VKTEVTSLIILQDRLNGLTSHRVLTKQQALHQKGSCARFLTEKAIGTKEEEYQNVEKWGFLAVQPYGCVFEEGKKAKKLLTTPFLMQQRRFFMQNSFGIGVSHLFVPAARCGMGG
jgi:hypothetical protein